MRVVWTEAALRDVAALRAYIALDNPDAANRQVMRIVQSVAGLAEFPDIGRLGRRPGTRELVVVRSPYLVAYRPGVDIVEILRLLHSRQQWPDSF